MFDLTQIFEFSRTYCIAICTVLVPANLVATSQTLVMVGGGRPRSHVQIMTLAASAWAMIMILHVATWLMIGVVMMPTFILLGLGGICLGINGWASVHPGSLAKILAEGRSLALQVIDRWVISRVGHQGTVR